MIGNATGVQLLDAAIAISRVDPALASTYLVAAAERFTADGKQRAALMARSLARDLARASLPSDPDAGVDLPVIG